MHIPRHGPEVAFIFHELGAKAALEDMPGKAVPARPGIRIAGEKHLHAPAKVGLRGLEDDVQVVGHDRESVHAPGTANRGSTEVFLKPIAVFVVTYNILKPIAAGREMVDRTRVLEA